MAKLWQKEYELNSLVEQFTVGNDPVFDAQLIAYDCIGSLAHAHMLTSIGILTQKEYARLKKSLLHIIELAHANQFIIEPQDEDVHTAVESFLTKELGDLGKKIHTARSRNDQVALDLRMYMRDALLELMQQIVVVCEGLIARAEETKNIPIPGRTHFQRAMPSSLGLFFGAYAESLLDTLSFLQHAYTLVNQCPLGSAAGYGVALPINRQVVADLLGFARVQNNVAYVGNSRGKFESVVLHALSQVMIDLSKLSTDLIIFSTPEFGYLELPAELCSGSSIMPQKQNPDLLELVRAKSATVVSALMQTLMITRALPSGYHRDFQETKQSLMESFGTTINAVRVCNLAVKGLTVYKQQCIASFSPELFATDYALRLVQQGMPFREAYKKVAAAPEAVPAEDPIINIQQKTHLGASGNLNLAPSSAHCCSYREWITREQGIYQNAIAQLLKD